MLVVAFCFSPNPPKLRDFGGFEGADPVKMKVLALSELPYPVKSELPNPIKGMFLGRCCPKTPKYAAFSLFWALQKQATLKSQISAVGDSLDVAASRDWEKTRRGRVSLRMLALWSGKMSQMFFPWVPLQGWFGKRCLGARFL